MGMNNKILTIMIPTYNMEHYLDNTLSSLIIEEKAMKQLEVIIINDGSKDKSSIIAHKYQQLYPDTFKVIDKNNGNYGSCINRGLLEATGKYIKILDADDSFDKESFSYYIDTIQNLDVDLILNDVELVTPKGNSIDIWTLPVPKQTIYNFFSKTIFPEMHMVTYKTEKLRNINYHQTEGISYTDQEWVFTPISTVQTTYYLPIKLYKYLVGREGQTMDPKVRAKSLNDRILVIKSMLRSLESNKYSTQSYKWLQIKILRNISYVYKNNIIDLQQTDEKLIEFDLFFKDNYPDLYIESEQYLILSPKYKYNYGKYWRKYYKLNYYNPFILIYLIIKRLNNIRRNNNN